MPLKTRIETAIATAIATAQGGAAPPKLAAALDYAVNPGGARIRPTICMSVSMACGDNNPVDVRRGSDSDRADPLRQPRP
jgi:geranylgeranyl diphosphate synthase type II